MSHILIPPTLALAAAGIGFGLSREAPAPAPFPPPTLVRMDAPAPSFAASDASFGSGGNEAGVQGRRKPVRLVPHSPYEGR